MQKESKIKGSVSSNNVEINESPTWTFLTNHTHILVCLAGDPSTTVRNLALQVGITERTVQRILSDLEASGVVTRSKEGRRNRYDVDLSFQLRHPLESEHTLGDLLDAVG